MSTNDFEDQLTALRPRLHRYCARMTGSTIDGEDVLQDTLVKALSARAEAARVDNLEGWLFRIAHNTSLDLLRRRSRTTVVPLTEDFEAAPIPEADIIAVSFQTFLQLPELQRCAVILKDVLGHSIEEVASIADCTPAAAKSALQRGRTSLRHLALIPTDSRLPLMPSEPRQKMAEFVDLFRTGDFDAIRDMFAQDVKVAVLSWYGRRPSGHAGFRERLDEEASAFVLIEWHDDQISPSAISCLLPTPSKLRIGRELDPPKSGLLTPKALLRTFSRLLNPAVP